jgi:hypothetical protein
VNNSVYATALDAVLAAAFDGDRGQARLARAAETHDLVVGQVFEDDAHAGELFLRRADWAACEAYEGEGWRWIDRAAAGELSGVDPAMASILGASICGLFELWPGREAVIRDRLRGVVTRLARGELDTSRLTIDERPSALWEARIVLTSEGARLVRRPLIYPDGALEAFDRVQAIRRPGKVDAGLLLARRAFLRWHRARERQPFTVL